MNLHPIFIEKTIYFPGDWRHSQQIGVGCGQIPPVFNCIEAFSTDLNIKAALRA